MTKRIIFAVIDAEQWPCLRLTIDPFDDTSPLHRQVLSLYDTCFSNFEVHLSNTLRQQLRALMTEQAEESSTRYQPEVESPKRKQKKTARKAKRK